MFVALMFIGRGDCGDRCDLQVANKKKYTNIYPFSGLNDNMLASLKTTRELILADDS